MLSGSEREVVGSREVLVGTREKDFDSLLPADSTNNTGLDKNNNTGLDNNNTLKSQPCFVCSFRWVLNGGPAGGESSSTNEKEKKIDLIEEKGGVVKSRVGTVDGQLGSGDEGGEGGEGGEQNSTIVGGEEAEEVNVSNNAGLNVGNGKLVTISHV